MQPCLKLFESLLLEDFIPDGKFFYIVYGWLHDKPTTNLTNRVARIVLSKLGWNRILVQTNRCLMLSEDIQRRHALKLYQAARSQVERGQAYGDKANGSKNGSKKEQSLLLKLTIDRQSIGARSLLRLAKSAEMEDYVRWTWASLLMIRIHPLDFIPD